VFAAPFWTADRRAHVPALQKAADAAVGPLEANPLVWLDETVITGSPIPRYLPILGLQLVFIGGADVQVVDSNLKAPGTSKHCSS
jgi:hypothetical protein